MNDVYTNVVHPYSSIDMAAAFPVFFAFLPIKQKEKGLHVFFQRWHLTGISLHIITP